MRTVFEALKLTAMLVIAQVAISFKTEAEVREICENIFFHLPKQAKKLS